MKATKLNAAVKVIAKIVEVMLWIATAVYAGMLVALVVAGAPLVRWVQEGLDSGNLFIVGDPNLLPVASDATVLARGFAVAAIAMVAMLGMMAVVFRNIHLIFSTSETESPFTKANVQRVRRIGELSIIAPHHQRHFHGCRRSRGGEPQGGILREYAADRLRSRRAVPGAILRIRRRA